VASAVTVSLLGIGAAAQAQVQARTQVQAPAHAQAAAQAQAHPRPAVHLPPVRPVSLHRAYEARLGHTKPGKIAGIVYARGKRPAARKAGRITRGICAEPGCPVLYNNGPVQLTPHVYLLLWGPNWTTDSSQAASAQILEGFYAGLGARQPGQPKDSWSTIVSQYYNASRAFPIFSQSVLAGAFHDGTTPPLHANQAQIAAEADAFAITQGITDLTDAQVVVATQSGTCPQGFDASLCGGTGTYCAWHSSSNEPYINLPYLLDAGSTCGEDFVNTTTGTYDGFSLVGGAEYANTITNPFPAGGPAPGTTPNPAWIDTGDTVSGGQVADKCAWGQPWAANAPHGDVTLSTGTFAMQSLWSNLAGACVLSDTVTITSPGGQTNASGSSVSLQLHGSSSAGYPVSWSEVGLPPNLTLSMSGLISGTPTTPGIYGVTVTAADPAGTSRAVSFNWTITAVGGPIKGPNGKCLDDNGGSTVNGNKIDIFTCNGSDAQKWTRNANKTLSVLGSCLSDRHYTGAGTKLVLWTCVGHKNEQWTHRSNGEYVLAANGLCLTDPSNSSVNGTQVQIRACKNFKDQHWSLPKPG
jgi:ricin-type beta-trefoil lectin protein/putative Ig domain-containing protein